MDSNDNELHQYQHQTMNSHPIYGQDRKSAQYKNNNHI
jgi:hypothetical protein